MKIKKISHKVILLNSISLIFCTLFITLAVTLFLFNHQIEEEVEELDSIISNVITQLDSIESHNIKKVYVDYVFADKDDIELSVKINNTHTQLSKDFPKLSDFHTHVWNSDFESLRYNKIYKSNNREYLVSRTFKYEEFGVVFLGIFIIFIFMVISIVLVSAVITKIVITPISNLISQAKAINQYNVYAKLTKNKDDEVGELVDIINETFEKKEQMIKTQKQFSQNISHELKTPLSIIKGYLDILKIQKNNHELLDESVRNIDEEIKIIENIINNLFLVSQSEQMKIIKEKINLNSLISKIKHDYDISYNKQEINIINNNIKHYIIGDKNLIYELFRGLIDNGIKYSDGKKIEILLEEKERKIIITIRDYGIGILESEKGNILNGHYRGTNVKTHYLGKGLGLSIIKEILDLHGASIEFNNRIDGLDVKVIFNY